MRDPGGAGQVVHPGGVVAAGHEHFPTGTQQRRAGAVPVRLQVVALEQLSHHRAELHRRRAPPHRRVHVHVGPQAEQRAMDHIGGGILDAPDGEAPGHHRRQDGGDVQRAGQTLLRQADDRLQLARRQGGVDQAGADPGPDALTPARRAHRHHLVTFGGGREGVVHRARALVDLGVAADPGPQRRPTGQVGGDRLERLGRGGELASHLPRQLAEHVLLAGEVLVEGDTRASGAGGDAIDAAVLVALLAEHIQGRVEDPLLGPLPAGADPGVVREGGSADDRVRIHRRGPRCPVYCSDRTWSLTAVTMGGASRQFGMPDSSVATGQRLSLTQAQWAWLSSWRVKQALSAL